MGGPRAREKITLACIRTPSPNHPPPPCRAIWAQVEFLKAAYAKHTDGAVLRSVVELGWVGGVMSV